MMTIKSEADFAAMRRAGRIVARIHEALRDAASPGVSLLDLDAIAARIVRDGKTTSNFLGYHGFPAVTCLSVNEEIVHGIPRRDKVIAEGDLVSVDFGSFKHGMCADSARTVIAGQGTAEGRRLVDATRRALDLAIAQCRVDNRLEDIGSAVQSCAEGEGYSVVRVFVGHGIGKRMHEDPPVHNYGTPGRGKRIKRGLVIAVEPMVNAGSPEVEVLDDGWTAVTKDRSLSAHFEHTIAVLDDGPWVLTRPSSSPGVPGHD